MPKAPKRKGKLATGKSQLRKRLSTGVGLPYTVVARKGARPADNGLFG